MFRRRRRSLEEYNTFKKFGFIRGYDPALNDCLIAGWH
jgi:hypothetical protein